MGERWDERLLKQKGRFHFERNLPFIKFKLLSLILRSFNSNWVGGLFF